MKMIDELLDEYHLASRIYGMALDGPIPSPEVTEWQGKQFAARAAVGAEIKRHYVGICQSCGSLVTMLMECDCTKIDKPELQRVQNLLDIRRSMVDEIKRMQDDTSYMIEKHNKLVDGLQKDIAARDKLVEQYDAELKAAQAGIKRMQDRIAKLEANNVQLGINLSTRDYFIVENGLWDKFVSELPNKEEFDEMIKEQIAVNELRRKSNKYMEGKNYKPMSKTTPVADIK